MQSPVLKEVQSAIQASAFVEAWTKLRSIINAADDFTLQYRCSSLFKKISKDVLNLKPLKLAIVATSTVDHLSDILKVHLAKAGFDAEIYLAPFGTLHQSVLDPQSELYKFSPDIVWLFTNHRDHHFNVLPGSDKNEVFQACENSAKEMVDLWEAIQNNSRAYILQNNADIPATRARSNFEGGPLWGRTNLYRIFNLELSKNLRPGVSIFDLEHLSASFGKQRWNDSRFWYHSKHAFSMEAVGYVAHQATKIISSLKGGEKKVLVLDLDNTLWGGVIADDGVEGIALGKGAAGEAFVDFQKYLLRLKEQGIILAICSKNNEDTAQIPFKSHPDMQIKLEDLSFFSANWNNKADNIKEISQVLNLGLDSFVFVDDNPAERALVKQMLPMVEVPDLPEDPAGYIEALDQHFYFEAVTFSSEDRERGAFYRDNAARSQLQKKFHDISEFLRDLKMHSEVGELDSFHLPRMAQLINKSNQFHLTTTRYTEAELIAFQKDPNYFCRYFKLKDRFGDNGLISTILLRKHDFQLVIDTWVMSCRVLSRGMEEFILNEIFEIAKESRCEAIVGKYIPTPKNKLVANLYERLGFEKIKDENGTTLWSANVLTAKHRSHFIEKSFPETFLANKGEGHESARTSSPAA